jgi:hypothetical protein
MRHDNRTIDNAGRIEDGKRHGQRARAGEAGEAAKECEGRWQPACGRTASSRFCMYRVTVARGRSPRRLTSNVQTNGSEIGQ